MPAVADLAGEIHADDVQAQQPAADQRYVDAGRIAVPLQRTARRAAVRRWGVDQRRARQRPELGLEQRGVDADALLALQRQRVDRVQDVQRAPEAARAPRDALAADLQIDVAAGQGHGRPVQAMATVHIAALDVVRVGPPVLRRRAVLERRGTPPCPGSCRTAVRCRTAGRGRAPGPGHPWPRRAAGSGSARTLRRSRCVSARTGSSRCPSAPALRPAQARRRTAPPPA